MGLAGSALRSLGGSRFGTEVTETQGKRQTEQRVRVLEIYSEEVLQALEPVAQSRDVDADAICARRIAAALVHEDGECVQQLGAPAKIVLLNRAERFAPEGMRARPVDG